MFHKTFMSRSDKAQINQQLDRKRNDKEAVTNVAGQGNRIRSWIVREPGKTVRGPGNTVKAKKPNIYTGTLPNIRNTLNKKSTRHSGPRIATNSGE